ncbi:MAG: ATPase, T2SS/T4P/T4SS family [Thermodesulfobacteriota bacterium]
MTAISDSTAKPGEQASGKPPLRLGDLLVKEGYVTQNAIEEALQIQKEEKALTSIPLGKILVNMGVLSADDLESALQHPKLRKNIGSIAVEMGLVKKEDLEFCLMNKKKGQLTGEALVEYGFLTNEDVHELLKAQINSLKLGELLIEQRLIADKDLQDALRAQKSPRALGEILCDMGRIKPEELNLVLEKYNKQVEIDEILIRMGFITKDKVEIARKEQRNTKEPFEQILLKKKYINAEQLQCALAKKHNIPFERLADFTYEELDRQTLSYLISRKYAEKHFLLPVYKTQDKLTVAIHNPSHIQNITELKRLYSNLRVECILITEAKFEELFEILYSKSILSPGAGMGEEKVENEIDFLEIDLDEDFSEGQQKGPNHANKDVEAEEIVNFIVKYGILNDASDIHLEQDREGARLRYRIDGILQESDIRWLGKKLPEKINAIISRVKVMSNLDISEKRLPQDGVFRINYFDKARNSHFDLDFRVATCRALAGENLTIRILDSRKANVELENLGHSAHVIEPFKRLLKSSAGMILLTGPTGSGKTSTLYGALRQVHNPGVKIITAEDPIEYSFPGVMQTQIQSKIGLTFSRLLRSFLRFDPDVILVGEIRDNETAAIAFDAAQTGHLLLSTLHTNDSISAIQRLADLGVENTQIASCVLCVLAQRLVRRICPFCKKEYVPEEDEWGLLFDTYPSHLNFFRGEGCKSCNYSGYKGRILLSEIFIIDKEMGTGIIKGLNDIQIKKMAIEAGMKSMLEDGLMKLKETTLYEILRTIPHDMIETFRFRKSFQEKTTDFIDQLFANTSESALLKVTTESFSLSNPETDGRVIEQMYEKYNLLSSLDGIKPLAADLAVFRDFVTENYYEICGRYGCSRVTFTIQTKGDRIDFSATPERS